MTKYFAFEVSLLDVKPRIWRSFLLREDATFHDLHQAIQDACGWDGDHLYHFVKSKRGPTLAGIPDKSGMSGPVPDAKRVALSKHVGPKPGPCCFYEYDFGDGWMHEVVITGVVEREGRAKRALTGGDRAFPLEDSGGIPGYERCVAAVTGKGWPKWMSDEAERAEFREWVGKWRPDAFDLVKTKAAFDE